MHLPEGYKFRKLELSDFSNNYVETLQVLTTVGEISPKQFNELYGYWEKHSEIYHPHVITDPEGTVVATGMLILEKKLVHSCGSVGHIEDIAVAKSQQGKKLGASMISGLTEQAKSSGCYKVILDCSPHNVAFYEKCGYKKAGTEMDIRF